MTVSGGLTSNLIAVIEAAGGEHPDSGGLSELYQALANAISEFLPGTPVLLLVAGTNVSIDNTDTQHPVISAQGVLESVVAGTGITVDNTDPANPVISVTA